jgi:hypothetical protein
LERFISLLIARRKRRKMNCVVDDARDDRVMASQKALCAFGDSLEYRLHI